jgi:hypothetical protein
MEKHEANIQEKIVASIKTPERRLLNNVTTQTATYAVPCFSPPIAFHITWESPFSFHPKSSS